ncbi:toll/interleukin-1 receptor domain-containing protein [Streptomyces sp. FB2]|uniref:toll/interleukin-1 receptor domain-containing protein n=1 Tax=Streptomyces sp. FB2 TaxID=2902454 RepID=UPI001F45D06B|nr:toll/interleukin-1 receptor domain-containing protein [Streptomyces sp. FB2]MCF2537585.1 toll/interleukin-1 receptor domain-containing protein [Streptomyces sp. FB2]
MKVFISWSGERSKAMAEFLQNWLPDVIQAVDPWVSSRSIMQGTRPLPNIADELAGCNFGIVCVTPESRGSEWVNFEAGALSKVLEESMVVPLLLDIDKAQVTGPLSQFQMTVSTEKDEVFKLVSDMNKRLGESALVPDRLIRSFEQNWPTLEAELSRIMSLKGDAEGERVQKRPAGDLLDEILLLARQQERRLAAIERKVDATEKRNAVSVTTRDAIDDAELVSDQEWNEVSRKKTRMAFERLVKYHPINARMTKDTISIVVEKFPESDSVAVGELRQAVKALADEIALTVSVRSKSGKTYKYDWPF